MADDNMRKWRRLVDEQISEIIGDGNIEHLPGAGRPLDLREDSDIPDDMKLAYKIMNDNDVMPEWIMMGRDLEKEQASIERFMVQAAHDYQQRIAQAYQSGSIILERDAERRWQSAQERIINRISDYNRRVLTYNLMLPRGIAHRIPLDAKREIKQILQQTTSVDSIRRARKTSTD